MFQSEFCLLITQANKFFPIWVNGYDSAVKSEREITVKSIYYSASRSAQQRCGYVRLVVKYFEHSVRVESSHARRLPASPILQEAAAIEHQ